MVQAGLVSKSSKLLILPQMLVIAALAASGCKTSARSGTQSASSAPSDQTPASADRCAQAKRAALFDPLVKSAPTCSELLAKFPAVETAASDDKIICPFLRILRRSGIFTDEITANLDKPFIADKNLAQPVRVTKLVEAATTFGCGGACQGVANNVSKGQGFDKLGSDQQAYVDIGTLYTAKAVAHDCGFNFAFGDHQASDSVRDATLRLFKAAADSNGRLTLQNIKDVKAKMCVRDFAIWNKDRSQPHVNDLDNNDKPTAFKLSSSDLIEVGLIFSLLGGVDQDQGLVNVKQSVAYADVDRLFHGEMPKNKTIFVVDAPLFAHISGGFLFNILLKTIEEKLHI